MRCMKLENYRSFRRFLRPNQLLLPAVPVTAGFFFIKERIENGMKKRHESREQAFVLLFEKSVSGNSMEDIIEMAVEARCIAEVV